MPLTDTQLRQAKPADKPARLYDTGGLYIEVRPAGGMWWRLKYRHGGKEKLLSLGTYPDVPLKKARERRDAARALVADGVDPSAKRKAEKVAAARVEVHSLEQVSRQWIVQRTPGWTAGTLHAITAAFETHVFPTLGLRAIADIQARDVKAVVQTLDKAGAGELAGRVFQRLRAVMRYAISEELIAVDPTYSLKPSEMFKPRRVRHRAAMARTDMPEFFKLLAEYPGEPTTVAALELLILTAVRPGEVRGACWAEIDQAKAVWRIPAERMKMGTEHLVPLSPQALAVLERIKPLTGGGVLVFPSTFYPGKTLSENTLNSALARMGYKGIATAHGFRTLFSTCANEHGWAGDLIEKQLAHEERDDVRRAYNRAQHLGRRAELMAWWGAEVDGMRAAGAA